MIAISRTGSSVLRSAKVARTGDEVIVQGEDDRDAFREASDEVTGERPVVVNVDEVDISHSLVDAFGEARSRVLRCRSLAFVSRNADGEQPLNDTDIGSLS